MQEREDGDELPHVDLNLTHVEVDLSGLTDFRTLLQRELDANMRPSVAGIYANHGAGVLFGTRIVGDGMKAARDRYHEALVASTENLAHYVRTSELLIAAIEHVTATYRQSDLSAAAIADAINKAAAAQAVAAQTPAPSRSPANRGLIE